MTKFDSAVFTVGPNNESARKKYESNWDSVFGKKEDEPAAAPPVPKPSLDDVYVELLNAVDRVGMARNSDGPGVELSAVQDVERAVERYLDALQPDED